MEKKNEWKAACMAAYDAGDFARLVYLLSNNVGDNGDVASWIDNISENADSTIYI